LIQDLDSCHFSLVLIYFLFSAWITALGDVSMTAWYLVFSSFSLVLVNLYRS